MASARNRVNDYPSVRSFESRAEALLTEAESRGEKVHGIKPWYCSARVIESGTKVAFIGANPGGGEQAQVDDRKLGVLNRPYTDPDYNAWLDDTHWGGTGVRQERARETFGILFGPQGARVLKGAACFNVVPVRSVDTDKISQATWKKGADWFADVLEHVAPRIIVCNSNKVGLNRLGVFYSETAVLVSRSQNIGTYTTTLVSSKVVSRAGNWQDPL